MGLLATAPAVPGNAPAPLRERLAPLRDCAVLRLVTVTFLAASGGLMLYTYLGPYTARVAGGSYGLLTFVLLLVGAAGLVGALLSGRAADAWGPQRSLRRVLAGHAIALALAAGLIFSGIGNRYVLTAVIACWAVFTWALTPPVQGSVLAAAGPAAGMTALSLNISGLYLGTGVAAAVGGAVVGTIGVAYVPVAAAALMALAFLLSPVLLSPRPTSRTTCGGAHRRLDLCGCLRPPEPRQQTVILQAGVATGGAESASSLDTRPSGRWRLAEESKDLAEIARVLLDENTGNFTAEAAKLPEYGWGVLLSVRSRSAALIRWPFRSRVGRGCGV